jgi:hypothetical protein
VLGHSYTHCSSNFLIDGEDCLNIVNFKTSLYVGIVLIALGILFNKWLIEITIVPDSNLESGQLNFIVLAIQLTAISVGAYLVIKRPSIKLSIAGIAIFTVSLVISLGLAEVALRTIPTVNSGTSHMHRIPHPVFGWVLEPDVEYDNVMDEDEATVRVTYNSSGWRDVNHETERPDNVFRILVLGDSFMEAYSVGDEETFSRRIEKLTQASGLEVEVINLGVGGYGTLQEYLVFRDVGRQFSPDIVLLAFYVQNDVSNNNLDMESRGANYGAIEVASRPFLNKNSSINWKISQVDYEGATRRFLKARNALDSSESKFIARSELARLGSNFLLDVFGEFKLFESENSLELNAKDHLLDVALVEPDVVLMDQKVASYGVHYCDEPVEIDSAWEVTGRILARLNAEVDEAGGQLIVFNVPALNEVDTYLMEEAITASGVRSELCLESAPGFERLAGVVEGLDIELIDLLPVFRRTTREDGINLFRLSDGHWNPEGHSLAAETVVSALSDRGLLLTTD